ncbi:sodium-coupled monocarboxylate transporter 2 [Octopus sinensis]|uniref:Sodium-coupled monocarboxylate transporter 2 n=1 Tax=Octopus sinensis TaxID=2607531 RepID=A0A6P7TC93_9MOLL|nr:sodium-coupled monocarboxylate transporter 2 [Octopus sinensis]
MKQSFSLHREQIRPFSLLDYVLFGLTLAISSGIGVFYAIWDRNKKSTNNFLLAGGNMSVFPVAMSLLVSFMSAITLLGAPAEIYNVNTMYMWMSISYFVAIFLAAHIYVPIFYRLKITSIYEYLELRFSKGIRLIGSVIHCILMLMYMAIVLYGPALALNAVTGFSLWYSVLSVGLVCTFYTSLGGMKAVLWTDTFQSVLMISGLLLVLIMGSQEVGGMGQAIAVASKNQRIVFSDFSFDPRVRHTFWSFLIGGSLLWAGIYGTNQAQVQRSFALPSLRKAQIAIWLNFPGLVLILILCGLIGIVMYAFYSSCDPKSIKLISASDQLLPLFVMDTLGHFSGVPGMFLATIFSGTLSSVATGMNSMSAVILQDFLRPICLRNVSEKTATRTTRLVAVFLGLLCLVVTYGASQLGGILQASLSLYGTLSAPILGLYSLGMLVPWANYWGAYAGLFCSIGLMSWISVGQYVSKLPREHSPFHIHGCNWNRTWTNQTLLTSDTLTFSDLQGYQNMTLVFQDVDRSGLNGLYSLSYLWYNFTAFLVVFIIAIPTSFLTGPSDPRKLDPRLICPIFDILCPFLPKHTRKTLHFGVRHEGKYDSETTENKLFHGTPMSSHQQMAARAYR